MIKKIPKKIHYCWFGNNELSKDALNCINSWKKFCPDYEIIEWNEKNYDVDKYKFTKDAYDQKKWAFVSDVARLDIIYNEGGIYLDTDVELLKPLDEYLEYDFFAGFENDTYIANGLGFGSCKNNPIIKKNLEYYSNLDFDIENLSGISCPIITSEILSEFGFKMNGKYQLINNCILLPKEYMCPLDYDTGNLLITNNTISIHHYKASWKSQKEMKIHNVEKNINKITFKIFGFKFGKKVSHKLTRLISIFMKEE